MYKKRSLRNTGEIFLLAPAISNPKYAPVMAQKKLQNAEEEKTGNKYDTNKEFFLQSRRKN